MASATAPRWRRCVPLAIAVLSGAVFATPFGYLVARLFGATQVLDVLRDQSTVRAVAHSVLLAVTVTVLASAIACSLAWLIERTNLPGRRVWRVLTILPLVIPSFVGAHAYVSTFAPGGLLESVFGWNALPEVRGFGGAVLVLTLLSYPYVLLPVMARLAALPASIEEGARVLGKGPLQICFGVVARQVAPAVLGGATLVFLYVISDFGAVNFVQYDTLTRKVFETRLDPQRSVVFSTVLGAIALSTALVSAVAARRIRVVNTGANRSSVQYPMGRLRWIGCSWIALVVSMSLALPVGVLAWWVVRGSRSGARRSVTINLTEAFTMSAWIAVAAAAVTIVAVMPMAWVGARRASRTSALATTVISAAFALPGLVIALSLVRISVGTPVYQTYVVLIASYSLHFAGQAIGAETLAFQSVPTRLHDAARMLGAGGLRRLVTIDAPLVLPGMMVAGGLVLLSVLKELPMTLMLRPIGLNTLATRIFGTAEEALLFDAGRLSLALVALSGVLTWLLVIRRDPGRV